LLIVEIGILMISSNQYNSNVLNMM